MRTVVYTDATELGGAELSLGHLVAHLDSALDVTVAGVDTEIVRAIASRRRDARAVVVRAPRRALDIGALAAHVRTLRGLRPDVLHCNLASPWSCQYAIAAALTLPATPVVAVYQLPVPPVNRQQHLLKRLTSPRVTAHVAVGERSAREVESLIPLPAGSVRTIHNGVPDLGRRGESPLGRRTIGAVGRLEPQKGYDLLLAALVRLPDASLRMVGDGASRAELERLAHQLGVAERVEWIGWTPNPRDELGSVDVFVHPARFEGFPLAILEAMLAELPVVATDVGSVSEAVISGVTGTLVPPDDPQALAQAIAALLADRDARLALGRNARACVLDRFTAAAMAESFQSLYEEICA